MTTTNITMHTAAANPMRRYRCLVADPPWMAKGAKNGWGWSTGPQQYPLMTDDAIQAMGPAIAEHMAEASHCWLWVPNNSMERGFAVLRAWGYDPKSVLTWVKPRLGLGSTLRNATEHLLFGSKSSLPVLFHGQPSWFWAAVQDHSHKPEEAHEIIRRLSPGPRLELFARRHPADPEWDVWGNEIESDIVLAGYPVPSDPLLTDPEGEQ